VKFPALPLLLFALVPLNLRAQGPDEATHAPDGGTIEQFSSILLPPVPHAPFSSVITAEWTKVLEDGSTQTVQNHRLAVRDGVGRIDQERRRLIPKDSQADPDLERIEISDPSKHEKYFCRVMVHVCALADYVGPPTASSDPVGVQEDKFGTLTREELGKSFVNGVDAVGTRETRTLNPGAIGNDRVISIMKEIWYSPQLGINVSVKRIDPRHGTQIINVTDIVQGDPDPKLFSVPSGYTVVDKREKSDHAQSTATRVK
jgi:hypothetical protein